MFRLACKLLPPSTGANSRASCTGTTTIGLLKARSQSMTPKLSVDAAPRSSLLAYRLPPNAAVRCFAAGASLTTAERNAQNLREKNDAKWESKLELLRQYKKDKGDCLVPVGFKVHGENLGGWVHNQRVAFRKFQEDGQSTTITQERIDKLNAVGFVWNSPETQWNSKLEILRQYKKDNGDCLVPRGYEVNGINLGEWVRKQRADFRKFQKDEQSAMTQERIDKLNEISFVWEPREFQWNLKYAELTSYVRQYGHCLVPAEYPKLGTWTRRQRLLYQKHRNGESVGITTEHIEKLDSLQFVWEETPAHRDDLLQKKLTEYFEEHGDCNVPDSFITPDGVKLGTAVHDYRMYKEGMPKPHMTKERVEKLDALKFMANEKKNEMTPDKE